MDEFRACLEEFKSRGYDELDTARVYTGGKQESWTAQAGGVKDFKKIATKVYPVNQGTDFLPENLRKSIDTSLAELGVDSIDLFYLHAGKSETSKRGACTALMMPLADRSLPFEVPLEVVNEYHQAGKIKELGLSNYTASEVSQLIDTIRSELGADHLLGLRSGHDLQVSRMASA
jgi:aflatoxin B1 aldehyde reductase